MDLKTKDSGDRKSISAMVKMCIRDRYEEEQTKAIEIVINSDTPHQIDPDTGADIVEVVQYNEVQTGHLTLQKVGEQLKTVKDENLLEKAKKFFVTLKDMVMGEVSVESGLEKKFIYEESGVEGAVFELHAKEDVYKRQEWGIRLPIR